MANICFNEVKLFGKREDLIRVQDMFEKTYALEKIPTLEKVQKLLNFECENWGRSCDAGINDVGTKESITEDGFLLIHCETAWNSVDDYWDALSKKYSLEWAAFCDADGEYWVVNDENRKHFPEGFIADIWDSNDFVDDDYYTGETKEEVAAKLNEHSNGLSLTWDGWYDLLLDKGIGQLYIVDYLPGVTAAA